MSNTAGTTASQLRDGVSVEVRQLAPDDYDAVILLSETLTERELYLRFFTAHPGRLDDWAHSLTAQSAHLFAIGAFEVGDLLGVANYAATQTPGCAEIAVMVSHGQHERGVGTLLLATLGRTARANGLDRFVADVLAENFSMLKVITDAGWPCKRHLDGSVFSVEFILAEVL